IQKPIPLPGGALRSSRAVTRAAASGTTNSLTRTQIEAFSGSGGETAEGAGGIAGVMAGAGAGTATGAPQPGQGVLPGATAAPHFSHCNPGKGGCGAPISGPSLHYMVHFAGKVYRELSRLRHRKAFCQTRKNCDHCSQERSRILPPQVLYRRAVARLISFSVRSFPGPRPEPGKTRNETPSSAAPPRGFAGKPRALASAMEPSPSFPEGPTSA